MNNKGADQTAWMRRLICASAYGKTGFLVTWLNRIKRIKAANKSPTD